MQKKVETSESKTKTPVHNDVKMVSNIQNAEKCCMVVGASSVCLTF